MDNKELLKDAIEINHNKQTTVTQKEDSESIYQRILQEDELKTTLDYRSEMNKKKENISNYVERQRKDQADETSVEYQGISREIIHARAYTTGEEKQLDEEVKAKLQETAWYRYLPKKNELMKEVNQKKKDRKKAVKYAKKIKKETNIEKEQVEEKCNEIEKYELDKKEDATDRLGAFTRMIPGINKMDLKQNSIVKNKNSKELIEFYQQLTQLQAVTNSRNNRKVVSKEDERKGTLLNKVKGNEQEQQQQITDVALLYAKYLSFKGDETEETFSDIIMARDKELDPSMMYILLMHAVSTLLYKNINKLEQKEVNIEQFKALYISSKGYEMLASKALMGKTFEKNSMKREEKRNRRIVADEQIRKEKEEKELYLKTGFVNGEIQENWPFQNAALYENLISFLYYEEVLYYKAHHKAMSVNEYKELVDQHAQNIRQTQKVIDNAIDIALIGDIKYSFIGYDERTKAEFRDYLYINSKTMHKVLTTGEINKGELNDSIRNSLSIYCRLEESESYVDFRNFTKCLMDKLQLNNNGKQISEITKKVYQAGYLRVGEKQKYKPAAAMEKFFKDSFNPSKRWVEEYIAVNLLPWNAVEFRDKLWEICPQVFFMNNPSLIEENCDNIVIKMEGVQEENKEIKQELKAQGLSREEIYRIREMLTTEQNPEEWKSKALAYGKNIKENKKKLEAQVTKYVPDEKELELRNEVRARIMFETNLYESPEKYDTALQEFVSDKSLDVLLQQRKQMYGSSVPLREKYKQSIRGSAFCNSDELSSMFSGLEEEVLQGIDQILKEGVYDYFFESEHIQKISSINDLDNLTNIEFKEFLSEIQVVAVRYKATIDAIQSPNAKEIRKKLIPTLLRDNIFEVEELQKEIDAQINQYVNPEYIQEHLLELYGSIQYANFINYAPEYDLEAASKFDKARKKEGKEKKRTERIRNFLRAQQYKDLSSGVRNKREEEEFDNLRKEVSNFAQETALLEFSPYVQERMKAAITDPSMIDKEYVNYKKNVLDDMLSKRAELRDAIGVQQNKNLFESGELQALARNFMELVVAIPYKSAAIPECEKEYVEKMKAKYKVADFEEVLERVKILVPEIKKEEEPSKVQLLAQNIDDRLSNIYIKEKKGLLKPLVRQMLQDTAFVKILASGTKEDIRTATATLVSKAETPLNMIQSKYSLLPMFQNQLYQKYAEEIYRGAPKSAEAWEQLFFEEYKLFSKIQLGSDSVDSFMQKFILAKSNKSLAGNERDPYTVLQPYTISILKNMMETGFAGDEKAFENMIKTRAKDVRLSEAVFNDYMDEKLSVYSTQEDGEQSIMSDEAVREIKIGMKMRLIDEIYTLGDEELKVRINSQFLDFMEKRSKIQTTVVGPIGMRDKDQEKKASVVKTIEASRKELVPFLARRNASLKAMYGGKNFAKNGLKRKAKEENYLDELLHETERIDALFARAGKDEYLTSEIAEMKDVMLFDYFDSKSQEEYQKRQKPILNYMLRTVQAKPIFQNMTEGMDNQNEIIRSLNNYFAGEWIHSNWEVEDITWKARAEELLKDTVTLEVLKTQENMLMGTSKNTMVNEEKMSATMMNREEFEAQLEKKANKTKLIGKFTEKEWNQYQKLNIEEREMFAFILTRQDMLDTKADGDQFSKLRTKEEQNRYKDEKTYRIAVFTKDTEKKEQLENSLTFEKRMVSYRTAMSVLENDTLFSTIFKDTMKQVEEFSMIRKINEEKTIQPDMIRLQTASVFAADLLYQTGQVDKEKVKQMPEIESIDSPKTFLEAIKDLANREDRQEIYEELIKVEHNKSGNISNVIKALRDRTLLDTSERAEKKASKAVVNEEGRKTFIEQNLYSDTSGQKEIFRKASSKECANAYRSLCSYQIKDNIVLGPHLKQDDIVETSRNRKTLIDWNLLQDAINMVTSSGLELHY